MLNQGNKEKHKINSLKGLESLKEKGGKTHLVPVKVFRPDMFFKISLSTRGRKGEVREKGEMGRGWDGTSLGQSNQTQKRKIQRKTKLLIKE